MSDKPSSTALRQFFPNSNTSSDGSNLIVNYLPPEILDSELKKLFEQFGPIESAMVVKTKEGFTRGYGFVKFTNTFDARAAMEALNGLPLYGKRLKVSISVPRPEGSTPVHQPPQTMASVVSGSRVVLPPGCQSAEEKLVVQPSFQMPMPPSLYQFGPGVAMISQSQQAAPSQMLPTAQPLSHNVQVSEPRPFMQLLPAAPTQMMQLCKRDLQMGSASQSNGFMAGGLSASGRGGPELVANSGNVFVIIS